MLKTFKNVMKCCLIVLIAVCTISGCVLNSNLYNCDSLSTQQLKNTITEDDWAFRNYGQIINGSKGEDGIDINVISAWEVSKGDPQIIVGVVDTGVDCSSQIFQDDLLLNIDDLKDGIDNDVNGYIDDSYGWDFYNNDNSIYDDYLYDYHGTYIATTIARVAPRVSILPVKFLKGSSGCVEDAAKAITYAITRGAKIINCSWNFDLYNEELYNIIKNNPDVLFVCAAGNSNIDTDVSNIYPCCYKLDNIITVTAVDNTGVLYKAAGYGSTVDIAAPGVGILVNLPENDQDYIEGTSVATAFVSASAALMLSINRNLSPKDMKNIIISSSSKLDNLKLQCNAGGYLNISACLSAAQKCKN